MIAIRWQNERGSHRVRRRASAGTTVVEAIVALVIALAVLATVGQLLSLAAGQRRATNQRATAVREAGNLMEHALARPWVEIRTEELTKLPLSASCRQGLPEAQVRWDVTEEDASAKAKRIRLAIDWQDSAGQRGDPVRLVAWRYADKEAQP